MQRKPCIRVQRHGEPDTYLLKEFESELLVHVSCWNHTPTWNLTKRPNKLPRVSRERPMSYYRRRALWQPTQCVTQKSKDRQSVGEISQLLFCHAAALHKSSSGGQNILKEGVFLPMECI